MVISLVVPNSNLNAAKLLGVNTPSSFSTRLITKDKRLPVAKVGVDLFRPFARPQAEVGSAHRIVQNVVGSYEVAVKFHLVLQWVAND